MNDLQNTNSTISRSSMNFEEQQQRSSSSSNNELPARPSFIVPPLLSLSSSSSSVQPTSSSRNKLTYHTDNTDDQKENQQPYHSKFNTSSMNTNSSHIINSDSSNNNNNNDHIKTITNVQLPPTYKPKQNVYQNSSPQQHHHQLLHNHNNNQPTSLLQLQLPSVLRYGETIESFFQIQSEQSYVTEDYRNLCTTIVQTMNDTTTDEKQKVLVQLSSLIEQQANAWRRLLEIRCCHWNNSTLNKNQYHDDLLRLHRRATSYFTSVIASLQQYCTTTTDQNVHHHHHVDDTTLSHLCRQDLLRIWLSYVTIQATAPNNNNNGSSNNKTTNHKDAARRTLRYMQSQSYLIDGRIGCSNTDHNHHQQQNHYFRDAMYYITWSKIEEDEIKVDDGEENSLFCSTAEDVLRDGLQKKAEPILDLHNALHILQQKQKEQKMPHGVMSSSQTRNKKRPFHATMPMPLSSPPTKPQIQVQITETSELFLSSDNAHSQNSSNMSIDTDTGGCGEMISATTTATTTTIPDINPNSKVVSNSLDNSLLKETKHSPVPLIKNPITNVVGGTVDSTAFAIPVLQTRNNQRSKHSTFMAPFNPNVVQPTSGNGAAVTTSHRNVLLKKETKIETNGNETNSKQPLPSLARHNEDTAGQSTISEGGLETIHSATKLKSTTTGLTFQRLRTTTVATKSNNNGSSTSRTSFKRPPLQFKTFGLGKAERVDPSQSMVQSDSDDDEYSKNKNEMNQSLNIEKGTTNDSQQHITPVAKKPKLSKMDLDYMWNWDPEKRLNTSRSSPSTAVKSTPQENDIPKPKHQSQARQLNPHGTPSVSMSSSSSNSTATNSSNKSSTTPIPPSGTQPGKESTNNPNIDGTNKDNDKSSSTDRPIEATVVDHANSHTNDVISKSDERNSLQKINTDFLSLIQESNMIRVNQEPYIKLGVIGKGGSCKVYRALSKDCSVLAIKKVKTDDLDKKAIDGYANEIALLKRLRGNPSIIQLHDSEVDLSRQVILLVMEAGEADLNHVLQRQTIGQRSHNNELRSLNMNFIRLTWQQMLKAVHSIHEQRIIHGDLKPANFLFVRGSLKLIDFGIAKAIQNDNTTNIYRENQIGTLNYMSPEAICDSGTSSLGQRMKCGRPSDIWSLGCILYQMVYGKTPFADLHMIPKLQAIVNPAHKISYPSIVDEAAIDAIQCCLHRNPQDRSPIVGTNGLLNEHRFLNTALSHSKLV